MSFPEASMVRDEEEITVFSNSTLEDIDNDDSDTVATINFVAYNVVAFVIVGVGIVGNLLNLVVLSREEIQWTCGLFGGIFYSISNLLRVPVLDALRHLSQFLKAYGILLLHFYLGKQHFKQFLCSFL